MDCKFGLIIALVGALLITAGTSAATAPKKMLVVTHTATFRHSAIPTSEEVLRNLALETGEFAVSFCRTRKDCERMLTPEYLKDFDAVFFSNTTGNLGIPDLAAFLDWIKQGHGFLGSHAATDTYHPDQIGGDTSYIDMIGGEFKTHGAQAEVVCIVEDRNHPSTRHFGPTFTVRDEIYEYKVNPRDKVHVLLALNKHPDDGHPEANQPDDVLISWCKPYGDGRVFYTGLGHREDVWECEAFKEHILGGIRWAMRLRAK